MKVLHLGTTDCTGGAARGMYRWHTSLRKLGVASQILCMNKSAQDETVFVVATPDWADPATLERRNLQRYFIESNRTTYSNTHFSHPLGYASVADNDLVAEADIVHVHWTSLLFYWEEIRSIKALGKAVVMTPHDYWAVTGGCHYPRGCNGYLNDCGNCPMLKEDPFLLIPLSKVLKQNVVADAVDVIVSPSHWMNEVFAQIETLKGIRRAVIPYCVDISQFSDERKEVSKRELGFEATRRLVLFCAEHLTEGRKGLDALIEVFKICESRPELRKALEHQIEFVLIGKGGDLVKIPTIFRVHCRGYIERTEDLCRYYSAADLLIYLGLEDNLPNVILEAMAIGTPVLAFNTGGVGDMITDGVTGELVRPGDVTNFAGRLAILTSDSKKLSWLGMNSRETIQRQFSERAVGLELRRLYETLVPPTKRLSRIDLDSADKRDFEHAVQQTIGAAMARGYRSLEQECSVLRQRIEGLDKMCDGLREHITADDQEIAQLRDDLGRERGKSLWRVFNERLHDRLLRLRKTTRTTP